MNNANTDESFIFFDYLIFIHYQYSKSSFERYSVILVWRKKATCVCDSINCLCVAADGDHRYYPRSCGVSSDDCLLVFEKRVRFSRRKSQHVSYAAGSSAALFHHSDHEPGMFTQILILKITHYVLTEKHAGIDKKQLLTLISLDRVTKSLQMLFDSIKTQ